MRDDRPASHFVATIDPDGGSSGSPVLDARTHRAEGILVPGETDVVSAGTCSVSLVCPSTGCRGEDATRAVVWVGAVPTARSAPPHRAPARKPTGRRR